MGRSGIFQEVWNGFDVDFEGKSAWEHHQRFLLVEPVNSLWAGLVPAFTQQGMQTRAPVARLLPRQLHQCFPQLRIMIRSRLIRTIKSRTSLEIRFRPRRFRTWGQSPTSPKTGSSCRLSGG